MCLKPEHGSYILMRKQAAFQQVALVQDAPSETHCDYFGEIL